VQVAIRGRAAVIIERVHQRTKAHGAKPVCVKRQCLAASKLARADGPMVASGPGVTDPKCR
jgi:hypothetical protein